MKDRELRGLTTGTVAAALVVWGLIGPGLGAGVSLAAEAAAGGGGSQEGQTTTAYLDYHEVGYSVVNSGGVLLKARTTAFVKEPAFRGGKVIRGVLQTTDGGTNEVAFAWDRGGRKLYLDLNGNLDLSDDAGGVFQCGKAFRDDYQTFTNVHLPFRTAAGTRAMLLDLTMNGIRQLRCSVALRSFWQGKLTLQGEDWEVGLVVIPGGGSALSLDKGTLLLRPWSERNQEFSADSYRESSSAFPFAQRLFFGNRAYELQCTNVAEGDKLQVELRFVEQKPKLDEVKVQGDFVHRVTMKGKPYFVVLDKPGASVQVPAGSYFPVKVWLKKDGAVAHFRQGTAAGAGRYVVGDKENPAKLVVGGPLTNSVSISRRGKYLSLNYELVGAAGPYELASVDRSHPPTFAVYQGDKRVASGKFEFG